MITRRAKRARRTPVVLACAMLLAAAACSDGGSSDDFRPTGSPPLPTAGHPYTVEITFPAPNAEVPGGNVLIATAVRGFSLARKYGEKAKVGEGHLYFYKDVDELPTTPGKPAVVADKTSYRKAATPGHTWENVQPGRHTFAVQLVNNDETPLEPPVTHQIEVTVTAPPSGQVSTPPAATSTATSEG